MTDASTPHKQIGDEGDILVRTKLNAQGFVRIVIPQIALCLVGMVVILIGLDSRQSTKLIWVGIGVIVVSLLPSAIFLGGRDLILDRSGFVYRWLWWNSRYEWVDIKSIEIFRGTLFRAAGVKVVSHTRGFLGLHLWFSIPDFFDIQKAELLAIMQQFRARAIKRD
jgi:hypothetical protein